MGYFCYLPQIVHPSLRVVCPGLQGAKSRNVFCINYLSSINHLV